MKERSDVARVIDSANGCPQIPIIVGRGSAKVIMWPGNDARHRTLQLITLEDGACTIALTHKSDAVYYVISGEGFINDLASDDALSLTEGSMSLTEGSMLHIDAGDRYRFAADAGRDIRILGGPCPADESLYADMAMSVSEVN